MIPIKRVSLNVASARVDWIDLKTLLKIMDEAIDRDERRTIAYMNIHVANQIARSQHLQSAIERMDHVYCDGAGIRLGLRLLGLPRPPRLTGADIIWEVARHLAPQRARLYWLGGEEGVARATLEILTRRFPGLVIAGSHHGFITVADEDRVIDAINRSRPDLLVVGMGTPRQELWIDQHRQKLQVPLVWAIGATGDFLTGKKARAPRWLRDAGFEWLHRLMLEPRRLGHRYLIGNPAFLARVLAQRLLGGTTKRDRGHHDKG